MLPDCEWGPLRCSAAQIALLPYAGDLRRLHQQTPLHNSFSWYLRQPRCSPQGILLRFRSRRSTLALARESVVITNTPHSQPDSLPSAPSCLRLSSRVWACHHPSSLTSNTPGTASHTGNSVDWPFTRAAKEPARLHRGHPSPMDRHSSWRPPRPSVSAAGSPSRSRISLQRCSLGPSSLPSPPSGG